MSKNREGKKGFSIWKLLFTLVFLALSILWVLYTVCYFGLWTLGWDFVKDWPLVSSINSYLKEFNDAAAGIKKIGFEMFLVSISILLIYSALFFPIKKIPILGSLLKTITAIIPSVATVVLIIACIFIWGNLDLNINFNGSIPY
ncbi:MAG: hypothetical protein HDR31_01265 [Mycoplasma sp.]|nr:hypothetical protein [Mycoplasma sp.]